MRAPQRFSGSERAGDRPGHELTAHQPAPIHANRRRLLSPVFVFGIAALNTSGDTRFAANLVAAVVYYVVTVMLYQLYKPVSQPGSLVTALWMRFENDSPLHELIRYVPHVAFEVHDLDAALEGQEIIHPPGSPSDGVRSAMIVDNGAPVEFIWFRKRHDIDVGRAPCLLDPRVT